MVIYLSQVIQKRIGLNSVTCYCGVLLQHESKRLLPFLILYLYSHLNSTSLARFQARGVCLKVCISGKRCICLFLLIVKLHKSSFFTPYPYTRQVFLLHPPRTGKEMSFGTLKWLENNKSLLRFRFVLGSKKSSCPSYSHWGLWFMGPCRLNHELIPNQCLDAQVLALV